MHRDDLTWPAADRDLAVLRNPLPPSRWPTKPPPVRVRWWRWRWTAVDESGGEVLASGHAPTERWAWTRADAAAKRIHDERMETES